ncbi:MAG TPA: outer membrane protein assembly factor BamD [Chitinivibrionales bacterium]|nr:outer membrane protein assembly factor BamD [Chitinivibrionales bacterium]
MKEKSLSSVITLLLVFAFFALAADTVKLPRAKHLYDCDGKFKKAVEKFNKKKYWDVENILTDVLAQCPGHNAYDSMLYYQAKSQLALKKYEEAKSGFDRIVQTYPSSAFYEESYFLLGYTMFMLSAAPELDQTTTREAQTRLRDFIDLFPKSPLADSARFYVAKADDKFAEKAYQTARFYEKIDEFESAIVYYRLVEDEYPQSKLVPLALLGTAEDLIKTNRTGEASTVIEGLLHQTSDEAIIKKAQTLKSKLPR